MKSFSINNQHDLDIQGGVIQMAEGAELTRQSIETVLNTKIGEWFFDYDYGIDMDAMLGKNPADEESLKSVIMVGLQQIDESLVIEDFGMDFDKITRKLSISFKVTNQNGESITVENVWG